MHDLSHARAAAAELDCDLKQLVFLKCRALVLAAIFPACT
jgi:hypothetical protein